MGNSKIDLRSDTVTRPTAGMMDAMMRAEVGDDVFREDPTVNKLEQMAASLFGMEAALFCPTGTMSNQVAIKGHTQPGDEVICEQEAHVYYYEGGGIARNSGAQVRPLRGENGRISARQIEEVINPDDVHKAKTSLVCLENSTNRGGGACYELPALSEIRQACDRHQLKLHLDGARLFNAMVARNQTAQQFGKLFHSISICLNKGLGCPAGSILIGDQAFIRKAIRIRKVFGGGMRQAGFLAATGIYALENHIHRLEKDHEMAKKLGSALRDRPWVKLVLPVETNIVIFELKQASETPLILEKLKQAEILAFAVAPARIRFVTHLDITQGMIERAVAVIQNL
jgi:threonine aldolase